MNVRHLTPRPLEDRSKLMAEHMKTMQSMAGDMGARHQMMEKRMVMMQTMMTYPFDPVGAEYFQQKLFIPGASGPFGVLQAIRPIRHGSFRTVPGKVAPEHK